MDSKKTTTSPSKLNSANRGYQVLEWGRRMGKLKVRGRKKFFNANGNQKRIGITIIISDQINFKAMKLKDACSREEKP